MGVAFGTAYQHGEISTEIEGLPGPSHTGAAAVCWQQPAVRNTGADPTYPGYKLPELPSWPLVPMWEHVNPGEKPSLHFQRTNTEASYYAHQHTFHKRRVAQLTAEHDMNRLISGN